MQGPADDQVGEVRVLGQQAAVEVGAEEAACHRALGPILAVVAAALQDAPERLHPLAEEGAPAVVLEADQGGRLQPQRRVRLHHHVADAADLARLGAHVEEADAREALALGGVVVVAEQLVATADGQDRRPVLDGLCQVHGLVLQQVVVDQRLLLVLAASEEEDVHLVDAPSHALAQLQNAGLEPAPARALQQREDVAAVAVDVHQVGVEPADGQALAAHVAQYGRSQPRLTSSARRSSMAV